MYDYINLRSYFLNIQNAINGFVYKLNNLTLSFGKFKASKLGDVLKNEEGINYLKWYISINNEKGNEKLKKIIFKLKEPTLVKRK